MARPKKTTATLASLTDCTDAMRRLLLATTKAEGIQAERDASMARLFKTYEAELASAVAQRTDLEAQLQQYYMTHLPEVEAAKKSIELTYGVMGRRLSPPALKLANKSWTWRAALVALSARFKDRFVLKREPEMDKDAVKAEIPEADLVLYGLKLDQEEKFYIELKRAEQESA
jgi:phage host-nuclease inhibitor protein Gam